MEKKNYIVLFNTAHGINLRELWMNRSGVNNGQIGHSTMLFFLIQKQKTPTLEEALGTEHRVTDKRNQGGKKRVPV